MTHVSLISRFVGLSFCMACLVLFYMLLKAAEPIRKYPSQLIPSNSEVRSLSGTFLLGPFRDIRELFYDETELQDLIRRKVCLLDVAGLTLGKETRPVTSGEVPVSPDMNMQEFLETIGMGKWKYGQPQFRIIKRDQIIQSPLRKFEDDAIPSSIAFLAVTIEPGDIIILARID